MNKFQVLAERLYQLQAEFTALPPEVYVVLQSVMHDLREVQPLDVKEINDLMELVDHAQSPGKMIVDLLRLTEKEHGIE